MRFNVIGANAGSEKVNILLIQCDFTDCSDERKLKRPALAD